MTGDITGVGDEVDLKLVAEDAEYIDADGDRVESKAEGLVVTSADDLLVATDLDANEGEPDAVELILIADGPAEEDGPGEDGTGVETEEKVEDFFVTEEADTEDVVAAFKVDELGRLDDVGIEVAVVGVK
ncbi:hypothetical protein N7468_010767 [Penicillium chermesinum]|uniref:Uncharacterized protein n=1 Tax=Penicillium chermesinum TaxID=63820 RepID=A0A9W9TA10_9EURO|nr:uncharacterized protein N7468_010767 [Penicillium chermesinum]KAJ5215088.1 hypothetical protein N7468_010767 [Penicillium chermesinum]KAJ6141422.1 hypothetical protein N7470_009812 [Penicillium chermesinum]